MGKSVAVVEREGACQQHAQKILGNGRVGSPFGALRLGIYLVCVPLALVPVFLGFLLALTLTSCLGQKLFLRMLLASSPRRSIA